MEVGNEPNSSSIPADGGETNHMPNSGCTAIFCRKTRFWVPDLFPATFRLQFMLVRVKSTSEKAYATCRPDGMKSNFRRPSWSRKLLAQQSHENHDLGLLLLRWGWSKVYNRVMFWCCITLLFKLGIWLGALPHKLF